MILVPHADMTIRESFIAHFREPCSIGFKTVLEMGGRASRTEYVLECDRPTGRVGIKFRVLEHALGHSTLLDIPYSAPTVKVVRYSKPPRQPIVPRSEEGHGNT